MMGLDYGNACIRPDGPVVAGAYTTITFEYTAGHPVDDTGFIKIVFRYAGDFGTLQFDDPQGDNYCSVSTNANCRIEPCWNPKGNTRPWGKSLYLKIMGGFLDCGDKVTVVFGDTSKGSLGWRMQTFVEYSLEFKTMVDPFATYQFKELAQSPVLPVIAGKVFKAVCLAPSQVEVNRSFEYFLKLEDEWGNVAAPVAVLKHAGFSQPGIERLTAGDVAHGLYAVSNPIKVYSQERRNSFFWADFHGQSEETIGTNSIEDYYRFAEECAKLDICAHQGNDFQITDDFWNTVNIVADKFNQDGKFVTFPGFEWSGNTPLGGDRNVYYKNSGESIFRSSADLLPGGKTRFALAPTADELFRHLQKCASFVFAHVGGRYANLEMHDPQTETAVEIHSAWGTFQWLLDDALKAGYRIGICANSDGHKGRPGASYPGASRFGSYGGLTCVLAEKLDREHIFAAMRKRNYYATTGHRCLIELRCSVNGKEAIMGDVVEITDGELPLLKLRIAGTAPIERISVRNKLDTLREIRPCTAPGKRIKVIWSGAECKGRDRACKWDGNLKITGNRIIECRPVNFWNRNKQLEMSGDREIRWESITTGGQAGMILELEDQHSGTIDISTGQGDLSCAIADIDLNGKTVDCGGLEKELRVYRPGYGNCDNFEYAMELDGLKTGDNPIYLKIEQEDAHIAWTSPVYMVRP